MKKGAALVSALVWMISLVAFALVLFVFLGKAGKVHADVGNKSPCKESVKQFSLFQIGGINFNTADTIKCPVQLKTIDVSNADYAKKRVADAMFDCFDEFGAGELNLFDTRRASTDHYCVVCSKVTFTNTDKTKELKGLADYLTNTVSPNSKDTYFEFFSGTTSAGNVKVPPDIASIDQLDTSKNHAIFFTYGKTTGWWDKTMAGGLAGGSGLVVGGFVAGFFTGGVGWVVAGAAVVGGTSFGIAVTKAPNLNSEWTAGVALIPYGETEADYKKIRDTLKCDELPIKQ